MLTSFQVLLLNQIALLILATVRVAVTIYFKAARFNFVIRL